MAGRTANTGLSTLIFILSALLLSVITAGALIYTSGSLREQGLRTADRSQDEINAIIRTIMIAGLDGTDMDLERFEQEVRLGPGSNQLRFDRMLITVLTNDSTSSLTYRGAGAQQLQDVASGYYTLKQEVLPLVGAVPVPLVQDYDLDGRAEYLSLDGEGRLVIAYSSGGSSTSSFNCSGALHDVTGTYAAHDDERLTSLEAIGSCGAGSTAGANITATPVSLGQGFYTVEYLRRSSSHVPGNLQQGEVARLHYETLRPLGVSEHVQVRLVPQTGTPSLILFTLPRIISMQREHLYPP